MVTLEARWVKLNFDGASKGNLGPTRIGCCIRDDLGKTLVENSMHIENNMNNIAKFKTLIEGLWLCNQFKIWKVAIEGDLTIVINASHNQSTRDYQVSSA